MKEFWDRVDRSGGPESCWPWTGPQRRGYGRFFGRKRDERAHRVAYELTFCKTDCEALRHDCDNSICCNPYHLILGTHIENRADCVRKGRHARGNSHGFRKNPTASGIGRYVSAHLELFRGVRNGRSKLSDDDVREIRRRSDIKSRSELAMEFGVSNQMICRIVLRQSWTHL